MHDPMRHTASKPCCHARRSRASSTRFSRCSSTSARSRAPERPTATAAATTTPRWLHGRWWPTCSSTSTRRLRRNRPGHDSRNKEIPSTMDKPSLRTLTRRHFFEQASFGIGGLALASLLDDVVLRAAGQSPGPALHFAPKVKRVIYLFMAGAPSQIDLFDPKPALTKHDGQDIPEEHTSELQSPCNLVSRLLLANQNNLPTL